MYSIIGDYDRAITDLSQAIELNPNLAEAYKNRSLAYYRKGDIARAITDMEAAAQLSQ